MDIQFYGANCLTIITKKTRIVIDDNLAELGSKSINKADDVEVFTYLHDTSSKESKILINGPGEYEVADISIKGIAVRSHTDEEGNKSATLYKFLADDTSIVITGHIHPDLDENELEAIGMVEVLCVPVGGHGYTLDGIGALKVIKEIEPKVVIPTHYDDKSLKFPVPQNSLQEATKELAMEPKETVTKLRVKPNELTDTTQLMILEHQ